MDWETQLLTIILVVIPANTNSVMPTNTFSYVMGAVIGLFIMSYLTYSLLRTDKF